MVDKTLDKINTFVPEKWRWVLEHGGFRKYFKNTGWMMLAKILSLIISFVTTIFIARKLGPENYGQLSYAISFVGLFSFIATMGLDQVLFRDLVKYPDKKNKYLGSAFIIRMVAAFLAIAACLIVAIFLSNNDVSEILIFIIASTFIFNAFQIINYEFQAIAQAKYPSIVSLIIVIILNILKLIIIATGKGVIYLAFILLLESILYAGFYILIYKWKLKKRMLDWKFDKTTSLNLIRDSWPMIFASAFALIYARIDQVMIKNMIDTSSVGIYDAAVRVSEAWYFVPGIIISSLFPAIVNSRERKDIYRERLKKLLILLVSLSVIVALAVSIFAPFIIKILYGSEFMDSVNILKIYIWSGVWFSIGMLVTSYLVAENFRKILFFSSFLGMSINVVLNLIFIPRFGIIGSAWATFISYAIIPLSIFCFKKVKNNLINN